MGVMATELNSYEIARLEAEILQLIEAFNDIEELIVGHIDIDHNGNPNLAMKLSVVLQAARTKL